VVESFQVHDDSSHLDMEEQDASPIVPNFTATSQPGLSVLPVADPILSGMTEPRREDSMNSLSAIVSVVGSYAALTSVLLLAYAHWDRGVTRTTAPAQHRDMAEEAGHGNPADHNPSGRRRSAI